MPQVGQSIPRLEARAKVTGRAEYVHNMRLPGMLHGKIFRSTVAHGRIRSRSTSRAARAAARRPSRHHQRGHHRASSPIRITARRSTTSRSSRSTRCVTSASRSRWCWPTDPHVAEEAASADRRRVRRTAGGVRRGRGDDLEGDRARRAEARRHLPRSQAPRTAAATPTSRSTFSCAAATSTRRSPRPITCSSTRSAPSRCCTCRSSRSSRSPSRATTALTIHTSSQIAVVRAHRDRAAAGLAGEPVRVKVPYLGGGFGAKLYIKLEALVAALALIVRRPVKIALTMEEQFYTHHQARRRRSASRAASPRTAASRARMRGVVERRRLCRHRPAHHAEVGLHRAGALRHRERQRSIPTRSTPTCRRPARCAASAFRSWSGPTRATPT